MSQERCSYPECACPTHTGPEHKCLRDHSGTPVKDNVPPVVQVNPMDLDHAE